MDDESRPMRIGVLGAARIVKNALLDPARTIDGVEVEAIAARDPDRARRYADRHGIRFVHRSYRELLADPVLDAVYIPLPAARHAEWTVAAIEAGKHVLCEKPFTSNTAAAEEVAEAAAASDCVVMEAYHSHHHPLQARLRDILASGELGPIVTARATFCVPIPPGRDIRWNLALGGGGLLDVGYYPVRQLRALFGDAPEVTAARAWQRGGIDRLITATLRFESGVEGRVVSSIWSRHLLGAELEVTGTDGRMRVSWPYHPHLRGRIRIRGRHGDRSETTDRRSTYAYQLEAFRDARDTGTGPAEAVTQMRTLDAIYRAAGMSPRP
ncbi:Gfo/Idh/MocA family oxidoreductase [Actinoplanes sichuanensis]|uniref:Gfo/Idh/MocA family protein n=1 Tax=Actinoplanes sichuanensis TaxID=512349 RepID=A0ABW4AIZ3_9ACTN|nr:Gfo/Idh/MocA family oxidoreductase [Actinoplanes sichuanensis]BEL04079.1 Gfo/Idh/MocA family oxidoreductase [Actinoplanes sichuanensis]